MKVFNLRMLILLSFMLASTNSMYSQYSLWGWGDNTSGLLSKGEYQISVSPIQFGIETNWTKIGIGEYFSIALKSDGTLWSWGENQYGQLGDGTFLERGEIQQIGNDNNWVDFECGRYHTLALKADGTLWSWGNNEYGQLGDNSKINRNSPVQIGIGRKWAKITCELNSFAICSDGTMWACGSYYGKSGLLGLDTLSEALELTQIGTDSDWLSVICGDLHTFAYKTDSTLWAWGDCSYGTYGLGYIIGYDCNKPRQLTHEYKWKAISCGKSFTIAIRNDGTLWGFGINKKQELGINSKNEYFLSPIAIDTNSKWKSISSTRYGTTAIKEDGSLWYWGYYAYTFNGAPKATPIPTQLDTTNDWLAVSFNFILGSGIKKDGTLWTWGAKLKYDSYINYENEVFPLPIQLNTEDKWLTIAAENTHIIGIKSDSTLFSWGTSAKGEIGFITHNDYNTSINDPFMIHRTPIMPGKKWRTVATGNSVSTAIANDGTLWGTGYNGYKGLSYTKFTQIGSDNDWEEVNNGYNMTVARKKNGTLWSFGDEGKICGIDTSEKHILEPTQIGTDSDWASFSCAWESTVALKKDGSLWRWGMNVNGGLGLGTAYSRLVYPTQWGSDYDWKCVSHYNSRILAIKQDGSLWGCGSNYGGALGLENIETQLELIQIGDEHNWDKIYTETSSSYAIKKDGSLWIFTSENQKGIIKQIGTDKDWIAAIPLTCVTIGLRNADINSVTEIAKNNSIQAKIVRNEAIFNLTEYDIKGDVIINLYDVKGSSVGEYKFSNVSNDTITLNLSNLELGMYSVLIKSNENSFATKIIKVD